MTFFTGRVFSLRLASPLVGGRGLHKRKMTLWHNLVSKKSKSVDSELVFWKNQPRLKDMGDQDLVPAIPPAGEIQQQLMQVKR